MDYNLTELKFEDQSSNDGESSSVIWVILFTLVMILSVLSNIIYLVSLATRKVTTTRILISCFFVINLLDYSLIIFEFSLGPDNQFSYTDMSCALYQVLLQLSPLLTSASLLLLVLQASLSSSRLFSSASSILVAVMASLAMILLLTVPTLLFSEVAVYPSSARHCVVDMSGVGASLGLDITRQHITTAIYNMVYRAGLTFWLPVLVILVPLVRLVRMVNTEVDTDLRISLSLAVAASFIVFYFPFATVTTVRQVFLIQSPPMAYKEKYLMDVMESLFKLLSFFFHIFRPLVCLVLETGASFSHEDLSLDNKLRSEEKKLLKTDEEI